MKKLKKIIMLVCFAAILIFMARPVLSDDTAAVSGTTSAGKMMIAELRSLYGSIPSASSLYLTEPVVSGSAYMPGVMTDEAYANALGWINYYRKAAGLSGVTFTDTLNTSASYGALCLAMNDSGLSHYPPQPADMSDTDYSTAYAATSQSNLSYSSTYGSAASASSVIRSAISGQVEDKDESNISVLGHRRWLFYPGTLNMGYGTADAVNDSWYSFYTDIRVFGNDVSKKTVSDYDFIAWPASGKNLTDTFPRTTPWSVTLNPSNYQSPSKNNVQVVLTRLSDGKVWTFNKNTDTSTVGGANDYFNIDNVPVGVSNAIIFRPAYNDITNYVGSYKVDITGIYDTSGNAKQLSYTVDFAPYDGDVSSYTVSVETAAFRYTGEEIKPAVTVTCKSVLLEEGKDYSVDYSDNIEAGTATITVSGMGDFYGTATKTFEILPDNNIVNFDGNGGSGAPDYVQCDEAGTVVLPETFATRFGYNFLGWSESKNATTADYLPGENITTTGDIMLYAVWQEAPYVYEDGDAANIDITYPDIERYLRFIPDHTCTYKFILSGRAYFEIYSASGGELFSDRTTSTTGASWNISGFTAGTEYYLKTYYVNSLTTGSYTLKVESNHTIVEGEGYGATCTEPGLTNGKKCSVCGAVVEEQEVIPALGHDYVYNATKEATCTEAGVKTYTCSRCDDTYTEAIPEKGHTPEVIPAVAATCTEDGLTEGSKCSVCGEILKAQEVIPAKGHTPVVLPAVSATCTEDGLKEGSKCSVCGEILKEQEVIPALGHDYVGKVTKEATCTEAGVKTYTCSRCSDSYTESIDKLPHTIATDAAVEPTETTTGLTEGSHCSVCGKVFKNQELPV